MFSDKLKNIQVSPIKQIEILASKIPGVVSLAQGIPSFDTPLAIKNQAVAALNQGLVSKYSLTMGLPALREIIEQKLALDGMFYDFESEIIVTCGAIEAISASLMALLNPGEEVLIATPSYTSYQEAIKIAGGIPIFINLIEENKWSLDINEIERKISSRTKAIILCNPNNPTGTIFKKESLQAIGNLALKNNFYIITDEVYRDFIYSDEKIYSLAEEVKYRKNLIRIFSFSKSYAMTGWRVGFTHSDKKNISEILKIHDSLVTCAPVISQYAAMAALEWADKEVADFKKIYQSRRDLICRRLDKVNNFFSYQKPDSSYFVFPKILIPNIKSWDFCIKILQEAKVATVPGIAFGPNGENHLRLSFGRDEAVINTAFDRLENYLNNYDKYI